MYCNFCKEEMIEYKFTQVTIYECNKCFSLIDKETDCDHDLVVTDLIVAGGGHQFWNICKTCFRKIGSPLNQKIYKPLFHSTLEAYNKRKDEVLSEDNARIREIRELMAIRKREFYASDYIEYIKSPEWKEKRRLILVRDKYECQICKSKAIDVHHLTYAHFKEEYDFELISLCKTCHWDEYHSANANAKIEKVKTEKAILNSPDILT